MLQFETARNVYLYSWFVYRFYPVAEHQSLACLELALRERLKEEIRTGEIKGKRPTLRPLLKYAIEHGLVKNEGFATWRNRGEINSRQRLKMEKLREMSEKNLTEIAWDESEIKITAEDLDWDYVKMLPICCRCSEMIMRTAARNLTTGPCGQSRLSARSSISFISRQQVRRNEIGQYRRDRQVTEQELKDLVRR